MTKERKPYPELGEWTIVRIRGEIADWFYAYNTQTGEKKTVRSTYDLARSELDKPRYY